MNDTERDALLQKMDTSIDELKLTQQKVHNAIFDTNGDKGLCSKVDIVCGKVEKHDKSITRLWASIAVIVGGGGGTWGIIELIKNLSGG